MKTAETACLTNIVNKNDIPGRMAEITATIKDLKHSEVVSLMISSFNSPVWLF